MDEINQLETPAGGARTASPGGGVQNPTGKRIILTTSGSYSDIHTYIAVGLELKVRGHQKAAEVGLLVRSEDGASKTVEAIETFIKENLCNFCRK